MQDNAERDDAAARLELIARILSLIYAAISVLWLMWILIPEHRRRQMAMRALLAIRRSSARAACRTGHQAMGLEISGRGENYHLPYHLSLLRDLVSRAYDKLRYTA